MRALLEERARLLAQRPETGPADTIDVITFELAGETYALPAEAVLGIGPLAGLTPLPSGRESVIGITEWRGGLLTVLDLRRLLELSTSALNDLGMLVVLGAQRPEFGILADAMRGVVTLDTARLHAPAADGAARRDHVRGLTDEAVVLLDSDSLVRAWRAGRD